MNGWLGDVDGLQISFDAACAKLAILGPRRDRYPTNADDLGIPVITGPH